MRWWVVLLVGCSDLAPLEPNMCGNGVVDPGEDCDTLDPTDRACVECRSMCTSSAACLEGWSCGTDSVCRRPSGRFEPIGSAAFAPTLGDATIVADVDGDGFDDLVADTGGASISWWRGGSRGLEATEPLGLGVSRLAAGDLDADGRSEIVANSVIQDAQSLSILQESGGKLAITPREGAPTSLPEFTFSALPDPANRIAIGAFEGLGHPIVALHHDGPMLRLSHTTGVRGSGTFVPCVRPLLPASFGPSFPPQVPVIGRARLAEPAELLAVAEFTSGPGSIGIYQDTGVTFEDCALIRTATIAPPANSVLDSSIIHLADVDADGANDLVFSANVGTIVQVAVARGAGDGTFDEARFIDATNAVVAFRYLTMESTCLGILGGVYLAPILTAGDVDGDARADFVGPTGVWIDDQPTAGTDRVWASARIADFNGDGHADVAALGLDENCQVEPEIDLLLGDGQGDFVPHPIFGPVVPHALAVGDFDGDRIADLAVADGEPEFERSSLWIFYGDAGRGLVDQRRIEFEGFVESIAAFRPRGTFHDLAVITANGPRWLTIIKGSSGRVPDAPILLSPSSAIGLAVGPIDLARGDDIFVTSDYVAQFYSGLPAQRPLPDRRVEEDEWLGELLLTVAPGRDPGDRGTLIGVRGDGLVRIRFDAFGRLEPEWLAFGFSDPHTVAARDLDGDDSPEAIIELNGGEPPRIVPHADEGPIVAPVVLELGPRESVYQAKAIQLDIDPEHELVLLVNGQIRLAEWSAQKLQPLPSPNVSASRIEVGDFDGDGFDDILLRDDGLRILRGCPHDDPCE
jgi:hypothetical protein